MKKLWLILALLGLSGPAFATHTCTTCYISAAGADTNDGTAKTTGGGHGPWLHLPGMRNATGNAASQVPVAGDSYILRGGDSWLNASFPVTWSWSGSSGSHITVGVDQTYFSGGAWNRPVFNAQTAIINPPECTNNNTFVQVGSSAYVDFNWIELVNYYWTSNQAGGSCFSHEAWVSASNSAAHVTWNNSYVHKWTVKPGADDIDHGWLGCSETCLVDSTVFDNTDGQHLTGVGIQWPTTHSIFKYTANALKPNNSGEYGYNDISFTGAIGPPIISTSVHPNCIESIAPIRGSGTLHIHDNRVHDNVTCEGLQVGNPGETDYVWNNLWYNNTSNGANGPNLPQNGNNTVSLFYWNNTNVDQRNVCVSVGSNGNKWSTAFVMQNNHCITNGTPGGTVQSQKMVSGTVSGATTITFSNNIVESLTTANGQGYTNSQTYVYSPTSSGSPTVGAGTNLTSSWPGGYSTNDTTYACTEATIGGVVESVCPARTPLARPGSGAWDSGAYEFSTTTQLATPTFTPPGPGPFTTTQTVTINLPVGATGCYTTNGSNPTGNNGGACVNGTTVSGTVSIAVNTTLKAIATQSGHLDSNVGTATYTFQGSTPTFGLAGGTYTGTQTIPISQAQSLAICYTTNGSTPTSNGLGACSNGTLYSGSFALNVNATVKAIGIKSGWTDSAVGSATYVINNTLTTVITSGGGSLSSSPAGISCPTTCSATENGNVTLTATPSAGNVLLSWGGACSGNAPTCTVLMAGNVSVTATFGTPYGFGCLSTATIPPPTVAPFSGITGAGTYVADPEPAGGGNTSGCFHNGIIRASDSVTGYNACIAQGNSSVTCAAKQNQSMFVNSSDGADCQWSPDDSQFVTLDSGSTYDIWDFTNISTAPTIRFTNFPNHVLKMWSFPTCSHTTNKLWYSFANSAGAANGTVLSSYLTSTTWPTLPTRTTIKDFSAGSGVPNTAIYQTDPVATNRSDTKWGTGFSTSSTQGTGQYVAAYTTGSGMSVWNTGTSMVTGDYGGTGAVLCQNCPGAPIDPGHFSIHNIKWSRDLTYAIVAVQGGTCTTTCYNGQDPYLWQAGTTNVWILCLSGSGRCSGHFVAGQTLFANQYATPFWIAKPYPTDTGTTFPSSPNCQQSAVPAMDQHASWVNGNLTDTLPFFVSTSPNAAVNPAYNACNVNEIDAIYAPPNSGQSGTVNRYAHNYGAPTSEFAVQYGLSTPSQDGAYVLMTSPNANSMTFVGQLGDTSGGYPCTVAANCRGDVFVVATGSPSPAPPSPSITNPTCSIAPCALTSGTQGTAYSFTFAASGGTAPDTYTWSVLSGTLPTGLSLDSTGCGTGTNCHITGTPTASGTIVFTIQVCDQVPTCASLVVSLTVVASPVVMTNPVACGSPPCLLPGAAQGTAYSDVFSASGGTGPYTWSITSGTPPTGLSLTNTSCGSNTACNLAGTPTGSGTSTFTIQVCDTLASCTSLSVSLTVTASAVVITNPVMCGSPPCALTPGVQGTAYSDIFQATGGTGPYVWSKTAGTFPTGLSLSSTGCGSNTNCNLQGTPSGSGTSIFTIQVCDTLASCTTLQVSLTIAALPIAITNPTCGTPPCILPRGIQGTAYIGVVMTFTGGTAPGTWTISAGSLPPGLSLDNTGCGSNVGCHIAGTPTVVGSSIFTVQVCDTLNACATEAVSLDVILSTITGPAPQIFAALWP